MRIKQLIMLMSVCCIGIFASLSFGQAAINPFDISPSTFFTEITKLRKSTPDLKPDELAKQANEIMNRDGFPFKFSLSDTACASIEKSIKDSKDTNANANLRTKLQSVGGAMTSLVIPPANFSDSECGRCSVTLPVLEATDANFVTLIMGRNINFVRPAVMSLSKIELVDESDKKTVKRTWLVPFHGKPIGISFDGNVVYLGFPDTELKDIALAVFGEGVFEVTTREEAESSGRGTILDGRSADTNTTLIQFTYRDIKQTLKFSDSCKN